MKIGVITQNGCFQRLFAYLGGKKPIIRGQTVNFLAEFCINAKKKTYTDTNFFKKSARIKTNERCFLGVLDKNLGLFTNRTFSCHLLMPVDSIQNF